MIYTHDGQRAVNPRHVVSIEIKDQGDLAERGRLTGGRDRRVYATDTNGGVHQLSTYRADKGIVKRIFDDAVAQVEQANEGRAGWEASA